MVPIDVVQNWISGEIFAPGDDPLINGSDIAAFFSVSDAINDLIYVTTEDDDADQHTGDWLNDLILAAALPVPNLSEAFNLSAGGLPKSTEDPIPYVLYVAGNGMFDSSFPLLVYREKDEESMLQHRQAWLLAHRRT